MARDRCQRLPTWIYPRFEQWEEMIRWINCACANLLARTSSRVSKVILESVGLLSSMAQEPSKENVSVQDLLEESNIVLGNRSAASDIDVFYFPDVDATTEADLWDDDCIKETLGDTDCFEEGPFSAPNTPQVSLQLSSPDMEEDEEEDDDKDEDYEAGEEDEDEDDDCEGEEVEEEEDKDGDNVKG